MREFLSKGCDPQAKAFTSRIELFPTIVYCVANGSQKDVSSPFLHFTTDFWKALPYLDKKSLDQVVVYLDLEKMRQAGLASELSVHA